MIIIAPRTRSIVAKTRGGTGPSGKSAYQLAVDGGFVGTEADWISYVEANGDAAAASAAAAAASATDASVSEGNAAAAVAAVEAISDAIEIGDETVAFAVVDDDGNAAFVVDDDGTFRVAAIEADEFNGMTADELAAAHAITDIIEESSEQYAAAIVDDEGNAALAVKTDGTVAVDALEVATINGQDASVIGSGPIIPDGYFSAELTYFANVGQSLAEGSNGALTDAQEYDNIGFPAHANAPTAYVTLTVANTEVSGRGESPMYGALAMMKQIVASEEGLTFSDHNWQLLACNNGVGGSTIAGIDKGTSYYDDVISQVQATYDIGQDEARIAKMGGAFFIQGEANNGDSRTGYRDAIIQFALDLDTDAKAITGQTDDVLFVTYQTNAGAWPGVAALSQLDAHIASDLVLMAGPIYQLSYYDTVHINANSSRLLGAQLGLAWKRQAVDGEDWEPLRPISHDQQGAVLLVRFLVPVRPLVMDTTTLATQTHYGFKLVNSSDVELTISSVELSGPDTVKIVAAAPIPVGAKLRYGDNTSTGRTDAYIYGSGNLRDSQGDTITFDDQRLDNWCVFFEYAL